MSLYHHILVPTDGSPLALKGAKQAVELAKDLHARLTAVYVVPPFSVPFIEESTIAPNIEYTRRMFEQDAQRRAQQALGDVETLAEAEHVECEGVSVTGAQPWQTIIETAEAQACDLIVMGSHGRGNLGALLLGSETTKVLTHSKTPVMVCR